jgi:ankyrin repeat protein
LLLNNGAAVNAETRAMQTPLHCAAKRGLAPMCAPLLDAGAAIDAAAEDGQTAFQVAAAAAGRLEICALLLRRGVRGADA